MPDLKIQHLLTLAHLLSLGARYNYIPVTTLELGRAIKRSQQAASRHLLELERGGLIERVSAGRGALIKITQRGYTQMSAVSRELHSSITSHPDMILLRGSLVSGMGEGAYYMSLRGYTKQFKKKIGYVPFPGTLNVRLSQEYIRTAEQFDSLEGELVRGFDDGKRTYGWVRCFAGKVNDIECNLIRLERTHHDPSIVELISSVSIRHAARLRDGAKVAIRIPMD